MDYFGYLDREYWESSMKMADVRKMNIIGIDWQRSGLCARRLVGHQGAFRTVPMLADGEYIHQRDGRSPERFFCGKLGDYFEVMRSMDPPEGPLEPEEKKSLLLVSVPESRLEQSQSLEFAGRLERMAEALIGAAKVILFPRIRVVWEYCRGVCPKASGIGVIQISEEDTQFLLHPGQEVEVSFGDRLAADGGARQYYHKPVRYRENNYLYEPGRFLWQDASYASWYQAFGHICGKVFAAQRWWEQERHCLALTGRESGLPCAKKALTDMEAAPADSLFRVNEVPSYLLWWFCRVHGLEWEEPFAVPENRRNDRRDDGCGTGWTEWTGETGGSGEYGQSGKIGQNIWDI